MADVSRCRVSISGVPRGILSYVPDVASAQCTQEGVCTVQVIDDCDAAAAGAGSERPGSDITSSACTLQSFLPDLGLDKVAGACTGALNTGMPNADTIMYNKNAVRTAYLRAPAAPNGVRYAEIAKQFVQQGLSGFSMDSLHMPSVSARWSGHEYLSPFGEGFTVDVHSIHVPNGSGVAMVQSQLPVKQTDSEWLGEGNTVTVPFVYKANFGGARLNIGTHAWQHPRPSHTFNGSVAADVCAFFVVYVPIDRTTSWVKRDHVFVDVCVTQCDVDGFQGFVLGKTFSNSMANALGHIPGVLNTVGSHVGGGLFEALTTVFPGAARGNGPVCAVPGYNTVFCMADRLPSDKYNNTTPERALAGMATDLQRALRESGDPGAVVTPATPVHLKWVGTYAGTAPGPQYHFALDTSNAAQVSRLTQGSAPSSASDLYFHVSSANAGVVHRAQGGAVWGGLVIDSTVGMQVLTLDVFPRLRGQGNVRIGKYFPLSPTASACF